MKLFARFGLAATVVAVFAAGCGGVASAHDGRGIIVVESQLDTPADSTFTIRVTWQNDGHPAADATVTATAVSPNGEPQTPAVLRPIDTDGRYQGAVRLGSPGSWTVRFSVVTPTATAEITRDVAEVATTSEPTTTSTTEAAMSQTEAADFNPDDGDSSTPRAVFGLVLLLAIVGAAVVGFARSSKKLR